MACNPNEQAAEQTQPSAPLMEPTRVLPARSRSKPDHFTFSVECSEDHPTLINAACAKVTRRMQCENLAQSFFMVDQLSI